MTEYNFGGGDHISGGLAQADVLGVFGREGLYLGNYWGNGPGNGTLPATSRRPSACSGTTTARGARSATPPSRRRRPTSGKASIYAATDTKQKGLLTVLVINKELRSIFNGKIAIKGGKYAKAQVYTLDAQQPRHQAAGADRREGRRHPVQAAAAVGGAVRRPVGG